MRNNSHTNANKWQKVEIQTYIQCKYNPKVTDYLGAPTIYFSFYLVEIQKKYEHRYANTIHRNTR